MGLTSTYKPCHPAERREEVGPNAIARRGGKDPEDASVEITTHEALARGRAYNGISGIRVEHLGAAFTSEMLPGSLTTRLSVTSCSASLRRSVRDDRSYTWPAGRRFDG
jgi:hypothetical protein